jgi:hypothetical protein
LTLTVNDDYDFVANKLIPKHDPNHAGMKMTTGMFAFCETVWEPRANFYLEKGISKLKEKDWGNIMKAASKYSSVIKLLEKPSPSKKRHLSPTEEEMELAWNDSGSDHGLDKSD